MDENVNKTACQARKLCVSLQDVAITDVLCGQCTVSPSELRHAKRRVKLLTVVNAADLYWTGTEHSEAEPASTASDNHLYTNQRTHTIIFFHHQMVATHTHTHTHT